jgi:hypothetical protein
MKQKIYDIALQAGGSHYPGVGGDTLQKFADIMLEECIKVVQDTPTHCAYTTHDLGVVQCTIQKSVDALREYFKD